MLYITKESYTKFPAGEVHVKIEEEDIDRACDCIRLNDYSSDGLLALAQFVDIVRNLTHSNKRLMLSLPYIPYSRQDRYTIREESFSLKIFANFINSLNFSSVITHDCHSDVSLALINNINNIPQWEIAEEVIPSTFFEDYKNTLFVSPDAGAYKKLSKLALDSSRIAIGVKQRDDSGKISGTSIYSPVDLKDKTCIIVDDICDGGKTFIELAKALKAKGAGKIYLYVTHGIFSKGLLPLKDAEIEHIYTTDSFQQQEDNFLTVKGI